MYIKDTRKRTIHTEFNTNFLVYTPSMLSYAIKIKKNRKLRIQGKKIYLDTFVIHCHTSPNRLHFNVWSGEFGIYQTVTLYLWNVCFFQYDINDFPKCPFKQTFNPMIIICWSSLFVSFSINSKCCANNQQEEQQTEKMFK